MSLASDADISLNAARANIEEARKWLYQDGMSDLALAHIAAAEALVQEAKIAIVKKFLQEKE